MPPWHSLFLPSADQAAVANALRESLTTLGYTPSDPFGLLPGKSYPKAVRLFVAPPLDILDSNAGWTRIIGEPDSRQLPSLSQVVPVLWLSLDGAVARCGVWSGGDKVGADALSPFLRAGKTSHDLQQALDGSALSVVSAPPSGSLPVDALPDDVRRMAGDVDMNKAQSMFNRLTGTVMKRAGATNDTADAARALIAGNAPDWNSPGGRQIQAVVACLTIPDGWRSPDFVTLRDAYQVRRRLERRPNADLYPGDAEAMAQVPDALSYVPVYAGAND